MPSNKKARKIVTPTTEELQALFKLPSGPEPEPGKSDQHSPEQNPVVLEAEPQAKPGEGSESDPAVYYNDCIVALDVLFENGSAEAIEFLRDTAERLLSRAGAIKDAEGSPTRS